MYITLCVIAYNEEKTLNAILEDIQRQDYDHAKMEILLVDGNSTDHTRAVMEEFAKQDFGFSRVVVLDNPKRTLPCGWNVALREYKGDAIIKVDAHAKIPSDFVSKNVKVLESGEDICGGQRPNIIDEPTPWKETLLQAENSMFGSGIAPYRHNPGRTYVKSMFHAAYRREVFEKVGLFNEELARTEDNEMHYRMRKASYKLCFDPDIISYQHTRNTLPKMLKQKYDNGFWIGKTAKVCPQCLSIYHFVPFAFVTAIILSFTSLISLKFMASLGSAVRQKAEGVKKWIGCLTKWMWILYGTLAVVMSFLSIAKSGKKRNVVHLTLPFLFFSLHVSYGFGTLRGLLAKKPDGRQ